MDILFEKLHRELQGAEGKIEFTLNNIKKNVVSTDIIGNILQDWLPVWFDANDINYSTLNNTQEFPDYIITIDDKRLMLEIKSWNANNTPAFDLANFESYIDTIEKDPSKLDAYYLILGYLPDNGKIIINDIYLKKIWELTGPSTNRPLRLQVKRGVIYNIRPLNFTNPNLRPFANKLDFLVALKDTMTQYDRSEKNMDIWLDNVIKGYNEVTDSDHIQFKVGE